MVRPASRSRRHQCSRFRQRTTLQAADSQFGGEASKAYKYLAVYEIETDDIAATIKELRARGGTADITPTDASTGKRVATYMFTPIKEKVMAKDVRRPRRAA